MSSNRSTTPPKPLAVKYPFVTASGQEYSDLNTLLDDLCAQSGGYYLLGANNYWHGGIHITDEKFPQHKNDQPVRCMMDGEVVAYRLNQTYPTQTWQPDSSAPAKALKFSNGFCLVRHRYESQPNQEEGANRGKTNKLTFYSLYMHLADYRTYVPAESNDKTVTITKSSNARNVANLALVLGTLKSGSVVQLDPAQTPKTYIVNRRQYDFYVVTVKTPAHDSSSALTVGTQVYLYAGCFPAGTFEKKELPKLPIYWKGIVTGKSKEPTEFDSIVKLAEPIPISAGDPIGFMGIWESPKEPFAEDKATLDKFLANDAGLKTGKKYLKVPKGSKLYSSDEHGGFIHPHELLSAASDYVFEESACPQIKDTAGVVFYNIKGIRHGEGATGPIDFAHVKIEGDVKLVTQHDWQALGFTTIEETNDDSDGFVDPEKIESPLFQDIFHRIDNGDGTLTGTEIKQALQSDKDLRSDLLKMIAGHPSEWHQTTQQNIKKRVDDLTEKSTDECCKKANQFEIDRFLKCEFVSQIDGLPQKLWHFNPCLLTNTLYSNTDIIEFYTTLGMYRISKKSAEFILTWESYVSKPYVPSGDNSSGVTVGYGYDLGQQTEVSARNTLKEYYSTSEVERLITAIGKKGQSARNIVDNFSDISITKEKAMIMAMALKQRYSQMVVDTYPQAINLAPDSAGAILSLVYNRGSGLRDRAGDLLERRREMREIKRDFDSNAIENIPARIRSMKRLWPNQGGLRSRREGEAKLIENELGI